MLPERIGKPLDTRQASGHFIGKLPLRYGNLLGPSGGAAELVQANHTMFIRT